MKKDVNRQIPELLQDAGITVDVGEKIFVSNYHGFCRSILRKYGYLFHASLFDIDKLLSVDDSDTQRLMQL
jgi:DNA helicase-2/ATP-dependent DNA helicase PcrA